MYEPENPAETAAWEASKAPAPDVSDYKAETIREGWPAKPRRAKPHSPIWGYIALGGWFAIAGLIGAFIGTVLAQLL
jgi:hypothetical protein